MLGKIKVPKVLVYRIHSLLTNSVKESRRWSLNVAWMYE